MYTSGSGKQPVSWLGTIALSISFFLPLPNTNEVLTLGGRSCAPGVWRPRSSYRLHYSFFTHAEPLQGSPLSLPNHSHGSDIVVVYAAIICTQGKNFNPCHLHAGQSLDGLDIVPGN